jgi:hypothetical protein
MAYVKGFLFSTCLKINKIIRCQIICGNVEKIEDIYKQEVKELIVQSFRETQKFKPNSTQNQIFEQNLDNYFAESDVRDLYSAWIDRNKFVGFSEEEEGLLMKLWKRKENIVYYAAGVVMTLIAVPKEVNIEETTTTTTITTEQSHYLWNVIRDIFMKK